MRRVAAWALLAVYLGLAAGGVALVALQGASTDVLGVFGFAAFAGVGTLVALRQPGNAVGWLLLAIAIMFSITEVSQSYVLAADDNPGRVVVACAGGTVTNVWYPLALVFLPLLFPDGRLLSPRWLPVLWLGAADLALGTVSSAINPGEIELVEKTGVENPLGVAGGVAELLSGLDAVIASVAVVLSTASVVVRFRRSRGTERQQVKWFAFVGVLAAASMSVALVASGLWEGTRLEVVAVVGWLSGLALIGFGLPIATGLAILRHRLYDIDVVIRRTLVYAALTATLAATYLGSVLLIGLALGTSNLAIAVSTLAVAALFRPALRRIQGAVDRRFYRRRYDAALTLEAFGSRLRDELDLEMLGTDLRGVVTETMQPAHVSLWLRSES